MRAERFDLPLRIVVTEPYPDLSLALQQGASGKAVLIPPVASSPKDLAFHLDVTVEGVLADGRPRFLGAYVQGPPAERFVYLCVWQEGGAPIGRMKIPLRDLGWPMIETLQAGGRIEGRVAGRNHRGGPALATVPILPPGWKALAS
jgi:hypothetical protein